ncbi:alpha-keto acid decarboxylase family protein [Streptomyces sp. SBT349]|uniref:alpha-keto acid decarboxylase family protein n=1 Tax=Streptomyces sp. SBT349 TaxID=1580539 RepID=UPI00066E1516|nr:thiamine pyrophosphate-binding protein [Streptomyces sp. SBT349]
MPDSTVGKYLATRLEQIGLKHYFVVPGDYNLTLLDQLVANRGMEQVGSCNELNAAYAAEGYARVHGCGALVTTFNVGALSALNGVAGAYAERLPVIFISSGPNTNDEGGTHYLHHTLGTHDLSYQHRIIQQVTCAAERVQHAENAPAQIDHAIRTALRERKPASIEIACNLAGVPCPAPGPFDAHPGPATGDALALAAAVERTAAVLGDAKKPLLLAGVHLRPYGAVGAFQELAEALGCAVAVMPSAKGLFPEDHPQYAGIYWGAVSTPGCEPIVDWADVILAAGPVFTDYSTVGWTALPGADRLITAEAGSVRCTDTLYTGVPLAAYLSALAGKVTANSTTLDQYRRMRTQRAEPEVLAAEGADPLTRAELWRQIRQEIDARTTLLVETGDTWMNGMYSHLPDGARFEIEMQWGSIGWALPASFGYAMGLEEGRRLISVIGDGSFQLTAQELANLIRYEREVLVILVNNRGYVVESEIHEGAYNYFKNWDYAGLVTTFNADDGNGLGLTATTADELTSAMSRARDHSGGPVLIEARIEHDDCSAELIEWGAKVAHANARPAHRG